MNKILLSIIVPVYNAAAYLERCLNSILEQEYCAFEVLLVDDGSTDDSPAICDRYCESDHRFKVIHKHNGGVSSARNAGLDVAQGDYVMFLDSDDALMPYALDEMMDNTRDAEVVVGGYAVFMDGKLMKDVRPDDFRDYRGSEYQLFFEYNLKKNCEMLDAPWAKLFKRRTIGELRFDTSLSYAEDKLFVFTVLSRISSISTASYAVYAYHLRDGSLGSDIVSDSHLVQLRRFIPLYSEVLSVLAARCPAVRKVQLMYHNDLVGRYLCRILNIFITRRTEMMTEDYIAWVYEMMSRDARLRVFSLRLGQVFNILLYKIGNPGFSCRTYHFISGIVSFFRKK